MAKAVATSLAFAFIAGIISVLLVACSQSKKTIKIKGSDTEVNLAVRLAESFHTVNPQFLVSISGGGSGLGIAALLNGQADIANSSRELNKVEDSLFKLKNIKLKTFVFAEDAVAFIVHKDFPLDTLTANMLANILKGTYKDWNAVTRQSLPINIYGRQSNSGTYAFIKKKLKIEFSEYAKEMNGNAQIIEAVTRDRSGIGYVGAGYVANPHSPMIQKIKVLKIAVARGLPAVSPLDEQSIKQKKYLFQRPLYQFIKEQSLPRAQPFLEFEKSRTGNEIIKASGYYSAENQ
jgi:phosphate transport system substrate-binding protein